jgi:hypothetical protein
MWTEHWRRCFCSFFSSGRGPCVRLHCARLQPQVCLYPRPQPAHTVGPQVCNTQWAIDPYSNCLPAPEADIMASILDALAFFVVSIAPGLSAWLRSHVC